jgi:CBS domain containing-hemolysin-like protein
MEYQGAEEFIAIYNDLDKVMEEKLRGQEGIRNGSYAERVESLFRKGKLSEGERALLRSYGELRNAIVHEFGTHGRRQSLIIAQPLETEVEKFKALAQRVANPPLALALPMTVKLKEMFTIGRSAKVDQVMDVMLEKGYSYVPILEKQVLAGVFSQDTIFTYLAERKEIRLREDMVMESFGELLPLDAHRTERFEFLPRTATAMDVVQRFRADHGEDKRLELIFFTESGKPTEAVLGMTTLWDLANYPT